MTGDLVLYLSSDLLLIWLFAYLNNYFLIKSSACGGQISESSALQAYILEGQVMYIMPVVQTVSFKHLFWMYFQVFLCSLHYPICNYIIKTNISILHT
jgi:hypothetical protein